MDSSFLIWTNLILGIYSGIIFLKLIVQFGLPNHPLRLSAYLISFCVAFYFIVQSLVNFTLISPWFWMKWRTLPVVVGGIFMLVQAMYATHELSHIQQKVFSRIPLIAGLLCFTFFTEYANFVSGAGVAAGALFLTVSVGKARYFKRQYFKMCLFLIFFLACRAISIYYVFVLGDFLLLFALFYFSVFESAVCVKAKMSQAIEETEGEV